MALNPIFPVQNYLTVTQGFKPSHAGNDYGWTSRVAGGCNQPIVAVEAGTVITAVDGYGNTYPNSRIYGNYVIVSHGGGVYSLYGHLLKGLTVKRGQSVAKGQVLGFMGNSGYSCGQHLHFEYRVGGNSKAYAEDPLGYLAVEGSSPVISDSTLYKDRIQRRQTTVGTPVARNTLVDQLEVKINDLNGRDNASVNADRLGFVTPGLYNILREQQGGSYIWYEIEPGLWCAYSAGWAELHKAEPPKRFVVTAGPLSSGDREKFVVLAGDLQVPCEAKEV